MNKDPLTLLRARARIIQQIREYFIRLGYLEVDTPILSPFLIPESTIEIFKTEYLRPEAGAVELYLTPSPEVWMKRLLAFGSGSIFQITSSFRNYEPAGSVHQPEFTMLEWYTVDADYLDSISTLEGLVSHLCRVLGLSGGLTYQGRRLDLTPPFLRISMPAAFKAHTGLELEALGSRPALHQAARDLGIEASPEESWEELFHRLLLTFVEPRLPGDRPVILYDYPAAVPTLSRRKENTPWAERWELYLGGIEVANCYTEESDPRRVEEFILRESRKKKANAKVGHRIDRRLPRIMENGFPECSGVALGVDRLIMLLLDLDSLEGVNTWTLTDIIG